MTTSTSKQTMLALAREITRLLDGIILDENDIVEIHLVHDVTVLMSVTKTGTIAITLTRIGEREQQISDAGSMLAIAERVVKSAKIMAGVAEIPVV